MAGKLRQRQPLVGGLRRILFSLNRGFRLVRDRRSASQPTQRHVLHQVAFGLLQDEVARWRVGRMFSSD